MSPSARQPGPGGTLFVELEGMGVTIQLLPSAGAVRIVQHGGDWDGQHSGFLFVPERDFAMTILTDSDGGTKRMNDFFVNDWTLSRFAGMHNLPAHPDRLSPGQIADYEGEDVGITIEQNGQEITSTTRLAASEGRLQLRHLTPDGTPVQPPPGAPDALAFCKDDYVLLVGGENHPIGPRANFVRDATVRATWLRYGGRLSQRLAT